MCTHSWARRLEVCGITGQYPSSVTFWYLCCISPTRRSLPRVCQSAATLACCIAVHPSSREPGWTFPTPILMRSSARVGRQRQSCPEQSLGHYGDVFRAPAVMSRLRRTCMIANAAQVRCFHLPTTQPQLAAVSGLILTEPQALCPHGCTATHLDSHPPCFPHIRARLGLNADGRLTELSSILDNSAGGRTLEEVFVC